MRPSPRVRSRRRWPEGDVDLARSFIDLAAERGVAVSPALIAKTESAERDAAMPSSKAASFARGFVTGKPEDVASAAGMLTGDLFVFGDVRDVVREGWRGMRGEEVDKLVLGLAGTGLAVTAGHVCERRPCGARACRAVGREDRAEGRVHRRAAVAPAEGRDARGAGRSSSATSARCSRAPACAARSMP